MLHKQEEQHNTFNKIYEIVKIIPYGKVATYGQIAGLIGPGMPPRIVGFALHGLSENSDVPWHRVINRLGKISYAPTRDHHDFLQQILLEREGVIFDQEGKVDMHKYLWRPEMMNK
jgi:methylated-DNA-protein-cysteine methyltransferase-like protein